MDPLQSLTSLSPLQPLMEPGKASEAQGGTDFSDLLKQAMQEVSDVEHSANQEARNLMTGEATDMHSAILAVQKADVSFQMMMAVRSKLISAYQEVMRMPM